MKEKEMQNLKPCPFCGGGIRFVEAVDMIAFRNIKVACKVCGMHFEYTQLFAYSRNSRVATNASFEEVWNGYGERKTDNA